ncbi:MAG: FxsA family protein [Betaproteobacteria bacterium]
MVILLGFPILDVYVTLQFAALTGIPVWFWLAGGIVAGWMLLRNERVAFHAKSHAALSGHAPLLSSLLDSGRKVLAGLLFILPGIMTDIAALLLLALPINLTSRLQPQGGVSGEVLDGEYPRLD